MHHILGKKRHLYLLLTLPFSVTTSPNHTHHHFSPSHSLSTLIHTPQDHPLPFHISQDHPPTPIHPDPHTPGSSSPLPHIPGSSIHSDSHTSHHPLPSHALCTLIHTHTIFSDKFSQTHSSLYQPLCPITLNTV